MCVAQFCFTEFAADWRVGVEVGVSFVILKAFGLSLGRARDLVLGLGLDLGLRFIVGLIGLGLGAFGFRIGTVNGHGGCIGDRQINDVRGCGPQPLLKYSGH